MVDRPGSVVETPTKTTNILLVEDSTHDVELFRLTLFDTRMPDDAEFALACCARVDEAEALLSEAGVQLPDVLLLDLHLPDAAGLDTIRRIVEAAPSLPVVIMTSHDDEALASQAVKLGAQDYLVKGRETVDRGAIVRCLRRAVERHQLQGSLRSALADAKNSEAELRRALGERKRLEEELRHTRRLEALGRLAAGVAHDFNDQLTVVLSGVSALRESLGREGEVGAEIDEIEGAAENAASLTRQLLTFGRQQLLRPQEFDLNVVVERLIGVIEGLVGEGIEVSLALAAGLGQVLADPAQVEQVIVNLVMNSRDAMSDGGQLTIRTFAADRELDGDGPDDGPPDHGPPAGAYAVLSVQDTGAGMDEAVISRIFEPFFSTKGLGESTGLGLSTVHGIVKQSGGEVRVQSEPGAGTVFHVYLPRVPPEGRAPSPPLRRMPALGATRDRRILLVEDEPAVRRSAARTLRRRGFTVLAAEGPHMALDICREHAVDLLLADVTMPGMAGSELAARVLETQPEVRVLFMSGYAPGGLPAAGGLPSEAGVLEKPYSPKELLDVVRRMLPG